jgi:leucyl aminopeptidase
MQILNIEDEQPGPLLLRLFVKLCRKYTVGALDIAGTAWNQEASLSKSYNPPGATGFGIRTIIKFIMSEII